MKRQYFYAAEYVSLLNSSAFSMSELLAIEFIATSSMKFNVNYSTVLSSTNIPHIGHCKQNSATLCDEFSILSISPNSGRILLLLISVLLSFYQASVALDVVNEIFDWKVLLHSLFIKLCHFNKNFVFSTCKHIQNAVSY